MIKELFQYVTTPCDSDVKRLGFLKESIGMEARYQRCKASWNSHYLQCRSAILTAVEKTKQQRTIVILGAGTLRDIPLQALASTFEKVILVDLLFLNSARKKVKIYSNVELLSFDISNNLSAILSCKSSQDYAQFVQNNPPKLAKNLPIELNTIDCIVSLNLITQIPLIPVTKLIEQFNASEQLVNDTAKTLLQQHLELLKSAPGVKCLIADKKIVEVDKQGVETDSFSPRWGVVFPKEEHSWEWLAVPYAESVGNVKRVHTVSVSIVTS